MKQNSTYWMLDWGKWSALYSCHFILKQRASRKVDDARDDWNVAANIQVLSSCSHPSRHFPKSEPSHPRDLWSYFQELQKCDLISNKLSYMDCAGTYAHYHSVWYQRHSENTVYTVVPPGRWGCLGRSSSGSAGVHRGRSVQKHSQHRQCSIPLTKWNFLIFL
jgi:hypothetical protein